MDKFLGLVSIGAFALGGYVTATAFAKGGSDIQLILGALYGLCAITAIGFTAILQCLNSRATGKEPA